MATNSNEGAFERPVIAFDGAIGTRAVPHPGRVFAAEIEFDLDHPPLTKLASMQKPHLHFHPYQKEYMQVLEGRLCVEVDGVERILTKEDGEIVVKPWAHHRLYPPPRDGNNGKKTVFILSGDDTPEVLKLDFVFFQNWYGYQDECVLGGRALIWFRFSACSTPEPPTYRCPGGFPVEARSREPWALSSDAGSAVYLDINLSTGNGLPIGTQLAPGWRSRSSSAGSPTDPRATSFCLTLPKSDP